MSRPRERQRAGERKPVDRVPLAEPGDPIALERCYAAEPEGWDEETLVAAVEMQRKEREGRLAAKARKRARERPKTPVVDG